MASQACLFDRRRSAVPRGCNWLCEFGPRLRRTKDANHVDVTDLQGCALETKLSRWLNRPPIVVGGMTPTTVNAHLVAAVSKAGYSAELAGGGQHGTAMFRDRVAEVAALSPAGAGVSINLLYLDSYRWKLQFPLCLELRRGGLPIESLTVAAGTPSRETAQAILAQLKVCWV